MSSKKRITIFFFNVLLCSCLKNVGGRDHQSARHLEVKSTSIGPCLKIPRWMGAQTILSEEKILVAGGLVTENGKETPTSTMELVEFQNGRCKSRIIPIHMNVKRWGWEIALLSNHDVLFLGGDASRIVEKFNATSEEIENVGEMLTARSAFRLLVLEHDEILITGGYDKTPNSNAILKSTELFNPKMIMSVPGPEMHFERAGHSITSLGRGRFLFVGGKGDASSTAEIFDRPSNSFSVVHARLNVGRKDHAAVVDKKGRVWILGGTNADGTSVSEIEYFDPITQKFVSTPIRLNEAREDLAASYVSSAHLILVIGGERKGVVIDGIKDPYSDSIDVIDLASFDRGAGSRSISSRRLKTGVRDEPSIVPIPTTGNRVAEFVVLQGLGSNHQGISSEKITIEE